MSTNNRDLISNMAEDVQEQPKLSVKWMKRYLPLAILLILALVLWRYFVHTDQKRHAKTITLCHKQLPSHTINESSLSLVHCNLNKI